MPARIALGRLAVGRGDAVAAAEQYAALVTVSGTFLLPLDLGSVDRRMGLLSQVMGELDQAATHFEKGLAFCRKTGYRPELAWTCCDYADTQLQRASTSSARTDDRQKAMSLLD